MRGGRRFPSSGRSATVPRVSDEVTVSLSLPLDEDGFVRRECPTCEREFKCTAAPEGEEGTPAPEGGYFCPYCAVQAPPNAWWTKAQLEAAKAAMYQEVVAPELEKFKRNIEGMNRQGGFLSMSVSIEGDDQDEPPLTEINDMTRVDFACHPEDPVKVLDGWERPVHCMICATPAASA